jgi:hypothetical protein
MAIPAGAIAWQVWSDEVARIAPMLAQRGRAAAR